MVQSSVQRRQHYIIPSAIIPGEFCYVLRPDHPRFAEIRIGAPEPVEFDPRVVSA
jgi:RES domain-containing protein